MPTTPYPIEFDGSANAKLTLGLGSISIAAGFTLVAVIRPKAAASFQQVIGIENASSQDVVSIEIRNDDHITGVIDGVEQGDFATLTADKWYLFAYSKTSGTSSPRGHIYNITDTSGWVHTNATSVASPARTPDHAVLGEWENTDPALLHLAAAGVWNSALTDANIESLINNFESWEALSPSAWWIANGATALIDETGGTADESSRQSGVTASAATITSPVEWARPGPHHTGLLDNFNRADAASDLGSNWTADISDEAFLSPSIVSNQADGIGFDNAWWNVTQFGADQEAFFTVTIQPDNDARLFVRLNNVGTINCTGYEFSWGADSAITRMDGGAGDRTALGSALGYVPAVGDRVGVSARGSTISAWKDVGSGWELIGERTDTTYPDAGYVGFWSHNNTAFRIDDFGGGSIASYATVVLGDNPAAYYRMNEGANTLIPNPDFEVDLSDWNTHSGTPTFTRDTGTFHAGVASGKVVALTNESVRAEGFSLNNASTYVFTVWVNGEAGKTLRVQCSLESGYNEFVLAGGWQQISASFGTVSSGSALLIFTAIGAAHTFYLDEVYLFLGPRDSSGNGNHVTVLGDNPTYAQTSAITTDPDDTSINTNALTVYLSAPDDASLDVGDTFSLECWVMRQAGLGTSQALFSKGNNSFILWLASDNTVLLDRQGLTNVARSTTTITDITTWHHIVATKTGSTVKLYIDGVECTGTVTNDTFTDTSIALFLCARDDDNFHVQAKVDEMAVYPTALTSSQVLSHYNAGVSNYAAEVLFDEPVAYYRMNEGTSLLASDTFTRADEIAIDPPWLRPSGTGLSACHLLSNAMSCTTMDNENRGAYYSGVTWPDDQFSRAILNCVSTAGVRQGPALYVRMSSTVDDFYRFSTDHAASNNCNVSRFLSGSRTEITTFTQAWTDGDTWELRVEGPASAARLRTFLNGVQISDNTDNSSIASGYPGAGVSGNVLITSWSVDDWEGGEVELLPQDSSGNGNHTNTATGTFHYDQPGGIETDADDTAIWIDSALVQSYFTAPDDVTLDVGDVVTIEAWIKRVYTGVGEEILVSKNTGAYAFGVYNDQLGIANDNNNFLRLSSITLTNTSVYYHVVGTKSGSTVTLYVNGVDVTGTVVSNSTLVDTTAALFLGTDSGAGSDVQMYADEIAIYGTALSAERVLAHYEAALSDEELAEYVTTFLSAIGW